MASFGPAPDGATLHLEEVEVLLMRRLTDELRTLVTGTKSKKDPVVRRLFPDAYEEIEDEKAYREMIGDDLTVEKLRAIDAVSDAVEKDGPIELTLSDDDFATWVACLTDLRLAIGTRLEVDEERMGTEIDPSDPDAQSLTILHWLGYVQDGLLQSRA